MISCHCCYQYFEVHSRSSIYDITSLLLPIKEAAVEVDVPVDVVAVGIVVVVVMVVVLPGALVVEQYFNEHKSVKSTK